jgi:hypothetical protein
MDGKSVSGSDNETGKSGSQPKDGVREPIGATLRVSGVIDPALARNTTGTAARAGTGNPTGNAPEPASGKPPEPEPEPIRRGRGRPAGSTNKSKAESGLSEKPLNINGVEKILFSIHTILAAVADTEELAIDEKEAKELAAAIAGVTNEYLIVMSPKTAAWVELGRVCGVIYGPRAVNVWFEAKNKRATINPAPRPQRPEAPPAQQPEFNPTKIVLN